MADRPIDCDECKKPIAVRYTEIVGGKVSQMMMCADCPHLERRLHGMMKKKESALSSARAALVCGNCSTTLDYVRTGQFLGCAHCYEVFQDVIIDDLIKEGRISRHLTVNPRTQPLHMGRSPGEVSEISPTLRLIALNEALDEMLIREDYEQAAILRDQIEKLKKDDREQK